MDKLTRDQAIALADTNFWESMSAEDIALFQLSEPLLCMPFDTFHKSVQEALGRDVYTHEFAQSHLLLEELLGDREPPTFQEILEMIPEDKRIVVKI